MYLDHFRLAREPFAIIPAGGFFYGGASRGAILDALIYVITHGEGVEGIIKVTGEEGSGKTTLFRELIERLPPKIEILSLTASPDWSAEGLLHVIAGKLESDIASGTAVAEVDEIERALVRRYAAGRQVVILVDDAHSMSPETLEILRVLYSRESSRNKLLQIALFGQAELDATLSLQVMHPLVGQITHHFVMQPFNLDAVREYLALRMRAAGYSGSEVFSLEAVRQITHVSGGLVRQINVLADQSLLAAFTNGATTVDLHHVRGAIEDAGLENTFTRTTWSESSGSGVMGAVVMLATVLVAVVAGGLYWQSSVPPSVPGSGPVAGNAISPSDKAVSIAGAAMDSAAPASLPAPAAAVPPELVIVSDGQPKALPSASPTALVASAIPGSVTSSVITPEVAAVNTSSTVASTAVSVADTKLEVSALKLTGYPLLKERIEATAVLSGIKERNHITVQLFATDNIQNPRMERFLVRASNLVKLSEIYVHPVRRNGRAIYRVTYGIYSDHGQADLAVAAWPEKYKTAFQPEFITLAELR